MIPKGSSDMFSDRKHWLDYATALFAFIAACGAIGAAVYSQRQAAIASDAEEKSLRAYVWFDSATKISIDGGKLTALFNNFGQTPAKQIRSVASWEFVQYGQQLPVDFKFPEKPRCDGPQGQALNRGILAIFPRNPVPAIHYLCNSDIVNLARAAKKELNAFYYGHIL